MTRRPGCLIRLALVFAIILVTLGGAFFMLQAFAVPDNTVPERATAFVIGLIFAVFWFIFTDLLKR